MSIESRQPPTQERTKTPSDVFAALLALARRGETPQVFFRRAMQLIGRHYGAPYLFVTINVRGVPFEESLETDARAGARWRPEARRLLLETQRLSRPLAEEVSSEGGDQALALAVPHLTAQMATGGLVLLAAPEALRASIAALERLRGLFALTEQCLRQMLGAKETPGRSQGAVDHAVARAASYESVHELAFAITNNLRARLQADQVAFGLVRGRHVRVVTISGIDEPRLRSPGTAIVRQAMEECLDTNDVVVVQGGESWHGTHASDVALLHRAWHESTGSAAVVSFPLKDGDETVAVLSMRRPANRPFADEEMQRVRKTIEPLGTGILLLAAARRSLWRHVVETSDRSLRWLLGRGNMGRKLVLGALLAFLLWVAFGTMSHEVSARASVAARRVHHHDAPLSAAPVAEVYVEPGDLVAPGQVLCRFDTRELEEEREVKISERAQIETRLDVAGSENRPADVRAHLRELEAVERELAAVERRIAAATVRARVAGVVLESELHRRVGEVLPLGERLLSVASLTDLRLELAVPEADGGPIRSGLRGRFASHARPDVPLELRVERVRPYAEVRDGRNSLLAEAGFHERERPRWLVPGLTGVAKVEIGDRPVWWLATHRVVDWVRMEVLR